MTAARKFVVAFALSGALTLALFVIALAVREVIGRAPVWALLGFAHALAWCSLNMLILGYFDRIEAIVNRGTETEGGDEN